MQAEVGGWRRRGILSGCRRRRAGEQGRSLPPPAPQASLSLFRPYNRYSIYSSLYISLLVSTAAPVRRPHAQRGGCCPGRDR
jgi:hypothetical protein